MRQFLMIAVALLALCCPLKSQDKRQAEARFHDGSVLIVTLQSHTIEVVTRYGKLAVPVSDIRKIEFGVHLSEDQEIKILKAVALLASTEFKDRDQAAKDLVAMGPKAYWLVTKVLTSPDMEVQQRAKQILQKIREASLDPIPAERDTVDTVDFRIPGRVAAVAIKAHSAHFGEVDLKVLDLKSITIWVSNSSASLDVDAAKFGKDWLPTSVTVTRGSRLAVEAIGTVDLWPETPGQYMVSPDGYHQGARDPRPGTLIARIGESGPVISLGSRYNAVVPAEGVLYLKISPSDWNKESVGVYQVKIRATRGLP